jgi:transposase
MREHVLALTPRERRELKKRLRSRILPAEDVRRARLILRLAGGDSYSQIRQTLGCNRSYISRWKQRFIEQRLAGLYARHPGRAVEKQTPKLEARILAWTRKAPPDGSTHWSTRKLAQQLGINHMMVARVWKRASLRPHRLERYMASNDPEFEPKAADIIGLYVHPPQHAAVFCVDEKSAIQALDRLDPVLPLSPGRAERHGFEYYRHGTLSLYAALNTRTGQVLGKTADRHTSQEFVAFLADLVASQLPQRQIHVIVDNLSAHKTQRVEAFLADHPQVRLHFTPTYSSWLNQVEN